MTILARKLSSKGPSLSRVSRLAESLVWDKSMSNMGALQQSLLSIETLGLHGWPKGRGVFSLVIHILIVGFFEAGMWDVTERMSSCSLHLAKNNKHVGESLGCRMQLEGHGRSLRWLGVKEVILEGLLVSQNLNLVISCVGPVIKYS